MQNTKHTIHNTKHNSPEHLFKNKSTKPLVYEDRIAAAIRRHKEKNNE